MNDLLHKKLREKKKYCKWLKNYCKQDGSAPGSIRKEYITGMIQLILPCCGLGLPLIAGNCNCPAERRVAVHPVLPVHGSLFTAGCSWDVLEQWMNCSCMQCICHRTKHLQLLYQGNS
jgi:hypothetical protein